MRNLVMRKPWTDGSGATAVEFALIAPAFVMIIFGVINLSVLMFTQASLHYSVEQGARCASVKTTICKDASTTQAYAQGQYYGASISPTFTFATAACGNSVSASATYVLN